MQSSPNERVQKCDLSNSGNTHRFRCPTASLCNPRSLAEEAKRDSWTVLGHKERCRWLSVVEESSDYDLSVAGWNSCFLRGLQWLKNDVVLSHLGCWGMRYLFHDAMFKFNTAWTCVPYINRSFERRMFRSEALRKNHSVHVAAKQHTHAGKRDGVRKMIEKQRYMTSHRRPYSQIILDSPC